MELNKDIKISYLRDPENRNRVMTLVTKRDEKGENLSFAFAINRPSEWKKTVADYGTVLLFKEKGEAFTKHKGLEIALGRLATKPTTVPLNGRAPARVALESLTSNENRIVQRIVRAKLEYLDMLEPFWHKVKTVDIRLK